MGKAAEPYNLAFVERACIFGRTLILIVLVLIMSAFVGCNYWDRSRVWLHHVYSADTKENYFALYIDKRSNEIAFGHSGLHFVLYQYTFVFLTKPKTTKATYSYEEVVPKPSVHSPTPEIVSGQITIDPYAHLAHVSLKTSQGDFDGNGSYPLKLDDCKHLRSENWDSAYFLD